MVDRVPPTGFGPIALTAARAGAAAIRSTIGTGHDTQFKSGDHDIVVDDLAALINQECEHMVIG